MRGAENAHEAAIHMQRDRNFREGGRLAGNVPGVHANVGRIVHFANGRGMAYGSMANLLAAAPVVVSAAAYAGQHQFLARFVVQVEADLKTPEGPGHIGDNLVDQLIEVEDRGYLLGGFLEPEQIFQLVPRQLIVFKSVAIG